MNWSNIAGFGIAGNFTGHLEQAGEASDFKALDIKDPIAPKGIFPFYIPQIDRATIFQIPIHTIQFSP